MLVRENPAEDVTVTADNSVSTGDVICEKEVSSENPDTLEASYSFLPTKGKPLRKKSSPSKKTNKNLLQATNTTADS